MKRPPRLLLRSGIILAVLGLGAVSTAVITTRGIAPLLLPPAPEIITTPEPLVSPRSQLPPLPPLPPHQLTPPATDASTEAVISEGEDTSHTESATTRRKTSKNRDIVRLGPGRYAVRREALETALANGGTQGAYAAPVLEKGAVIGYRIGGVTGKLQQLGLRNGDVVTALNGRKLSSPEAAIAAYGGIRTAKRATITVRRGGRRVSLGYRIVD